MAAQKAELERVRQQAMARFAEDARLAALTAQARRARTLAYKRELDATMAQRQAMFEQQLVDGGCLCVFIITNQQIKRGGGAQIWCCVRSASQQLPPGG